MSEKVSVLLIGSGGREHAMAWKIAQSTLLDKLWIAPGNPGTAQHGSNVQLDTGNFDELYRFVEEKGIGLVVVGPEKPLVDGIADYLDEKGVPVFGPSKIPAQLEGSKEFAKLFMKKYKIPTAGFETFEAEQFDEAFQYIKKQDSYPAVLKADGLAGGKGVFICPDADDVEKRLGQMKSDSSLKSAAEKLVVEEFMEGEEASVFVISDGKNYKVIHNAQDHKRIGEGDTGLNTGGMGAYSPAPIMTQEMLNRVDSEIIKPTIDGMDKDGNPYQGILYVGLMITDTGPKVVEYNCRFGDPECQAILPSMKSDLLKLMIAAADGSLHKEELQIDNNYRCCVVMASDGYPVSYEKGKEISGIDDIDSDCIVFHAGTRLDGNRLLTNGGRVLNVVGSGSTLPDAINHAYENVKRISFSNAYYRNDIGHKGLQKV